MSMQDARTKRPLLLGEGRVQLIEQRVAKKPKSNEEVPTNIDSFQFYTKGEHAWVMKELPRDLAFLTLNLRKRTKLVSLIYLSQPPFISPTKF